MAPLVFALALSASVATALLAPHTLSWIKVNANLSLGVGCFFLGLGCYKRRFADLLGNPSGLGNLAFSSFIGTFLWPALGLAAAVLAHLCVLPFAVVVGLALLAACPVGGPSNGVNVATAGGSLECSVLMCFLSTPAALITFPYAYRHFLLLLLDLPQPTPAASPGAAAAAAEVRATLLGGSSSGGGGGGGEPTVPQAVLYGIWEHALLAAALPLAAGFAVSLLLPAVLSSPAARRAIRDAAPAAASAMIVLTASTKTAAASGAVAAGGLGVAAAVAALHVAALLLGYAIPAGVHAPSTTCRTTALQASMRNPALGLGLATALFGSSPHFPALAAPCVVSIFVQNMLGAWWSLGVAGMAPAPPPVGPHGVPLSPRAFKANSQDAILRQATFKRVSQEMQQGDESKED